MATPPQPSCRATNIIDNVCLQLHSLIYSHTLQQSTSLQLLYNVVYIQLDFVH